MLEGSYNTVAVIDEGTVTGLLSVRCVCVRACVRACVWVGGCARVSSPFARARAGA